MGKRNYLIIGGTIAIFIIVIAVIFFIGNTKEDWTTDILESNSYQITMTDCNNREKKLDNNILNELSKKWTTLSNNGPWTGNSDTCYTNILITYDNDGIINTKEILLIDNSSLALIVGNNSIYYTNANEIINYLNGLFIK